MRDTWSNNRHRSINSSPNYSPCLPETTNTNLIDEVLDMIYAEGLFAVDDSVQVGLHEVTDNVHVLKLFE